MSPPQQRKAVRVAVSIEFDYSDGCPPIHARISDLSETGAFVDATHPLAIGSLVDFRFCLPVSPEKAIKGKARVVWTEPMIGIALEFQDLSQEDRDRIRIFVASTFFGQQFAS